MASKALVDIAIKIGKQLGANTNKFLGSRTNISFLGSGPKDDLLFQQGVNTEALGAFPLEKLLPQVESSLGYATAGKLNDIQMNKLIDNLTKIKEFHFPSQIPNITDMATGTRDLTQEGLGALRKMDDGFTIRSDVPVKDSKFNIRRDVPDTDPNFTIKADEVGPEIKQFNEDFASRLAAQEGVAPEETILPTSNLIKNIESRMKNIKGTSSKLDDAMKEYENIYKPRGTNEISALETQE